MVALGAAACGDDVTVSEQPAPTPVVRAVVVSPSAATIGLPGSFTFGAAVDADAGLATTVTWSSSNPGVATVVNGVATASSAGTASICATSTVDANKSSCAQLTVVAPPPAAITSVEVTPMSASIPTGGTFTFVANVQATGNAARTVTWSSSNTNIASVNGGVVTASQTPGSVAICAASTVDANFRTCVALTVVGSTATVRSVNVTPSSANLLVGESVTLGASVDADAGVARTVTWSSSNPAIASVTSAGVVTASATNTGVTAVCASSTVDNNIRSCAQITVSTPPAPEPAQIAIQSITVGGNLNAPVNVNNVNGQIDVTVIVTPNDQSVTAVDILVDDQVASTQTFTAQDAEALAGNLTGAARTVTLSFDTRILNASNQPRYMNGQRVIRARLRVLAGQGATGADALQTLTFANIDRLLIQTAPVGASNTADDANGLRWTRTQGGYSGTITYISYSGRTPATMTVKPFCNSGLTVSATVAGFNGTWSRTAAQMLGYVTADTLCDIQLGELPTVTALTMTDGNPAPAGIATDAATSAENMPARRRIDNAAPANLDVVNNVRVAPAADGWMNATYNIATATPTTSSTDAGVGFPTTNRRSWFYFGCGQGTAAAPIAFDGTGANIPECESDRTNNTVYTILYIERDALGNETTLPAGSRRTVGVDKTAPTARWSSTSNPNLAIRNTAGTLIPEFRDIGSGFLTTSAVSGNQVRGSRAELNATSRPNYLGCYRLDGTAPGGTNLTAPTGTDPFGEAAPGCATLLLTSSLSELGAPDADGWRRGQNLAAGWLNYVLRFNVTATDRAGNAAVALTRSILVDNTAPEGATVTSIPTAFTSAQPVVTVEYRDNVKVTGGALRMSYTNGVTLRYPFTELSPAFGVPLNAVNLSQQMTPNYVGPFIVGISANFAAPTARLSGVQASISDAQSNITASAVDPVPTQYVTLPTGSVTATSFEVLSTLSSGAVRATMNTGSVNGTNPFAAVHFYRRLADGSWQYVGQTTSPSVTDVSIFDQTKVLTWSLSAADRARSETSTALVDAVASGDVVVAIGVRSNGAGHLTGATTIGMPNAFTSLSSSITSQNVRGPSVTYNTSNTAGGTTNSTILPTYFSGLSRTNITNGMQLTITRGTVVRNNIGGLPSTNTETYTCTSSNTLRATVSVSGTNCVVTGGQESGDVTITWSATAGAVAGTTANTVSSSTSLVNTGAVAVALELFGNSTWIASGSGANLFQDRAIYAPGASVSIIGQVVRPSNISASGYGAGVVICQTDRPDLVTVTPATTTISSVSYPTCNIVSNVPLTASTEVNVALRVNLPAENGLSAVTFEQSRKLTLIPSAQATSMTVSNGPLALARPSGSPTTSSVVGSIVRNTGTGTPGAITATCSSSNTSVVTVPGAATIAGDIATCPVSLGSTPGSATVTITATAPAYTVGNTTVAAQTFSSTRTFTVLESVVSVPTTVLAQNQLATPFTPVTHLGGAASRTFSVSPALPAGLTMNASTGQITGTPTVASAATTYTVTITDAGGAVAQTRNFSLTVSGVLVATTNAPSARIFNASGSTITFTPVSASGGTAPYTFALTGEFPGTLALNTATGVVSGVVNTPTNLTVTYTVVVTDALGEQAQSNFTLRVNPTLAVTGGGTIQITQGQTLPTTTVATVTGGSPAIVASPLGTLFGMTQSYNAGTGQYQLSGTATSNNGGSAATQTASFTDAISTPAVTQTYTVAVWPSISTTLVTPNVTLTAGVAYSGTTIQPVTATGGRPALSYSVAPALPAGVTMNSANGAITGTPSIAAPGQTYTVTVTDVNGATATRSFELAVAGSPPNAPAAPTAAAASSFSATVNWVAPAQGGAPISAYEVQWALASAPTTWIGTQSTGNVLTTTVTGLTAGQSYVFRVAASNAFGQSAFSGASAAVALPLFPTIAPNQTPFAWTAGFAITGYTPAIGTSTIPGTPAYTLSGAPGFLSINAATGAVSGTPTAGVYNFNVVYTDALNQSVSQAVVLNVNAAMALTPANQLLEFTVNSPYNLSPLTPAGGTGTPPYAWSVSPALPTGLTLNAGTGVLSGTPTVVVQPASVYTVTVTDAVGATATATLNIATGNPPAAPATPTIGALSTTTAVVNWVSPSSPDAPISQYEVEYRLNVGPGPWIAGGFINHPTVTTTLTGLTANTAYQVRVRAISVYGASAWSGNGGPFTTPQVLGINALPTPINLTVGTPITALQSPANQGTGGQPPYTYSISGTLPAGLSFSTTTGQITGTPTTAGGPTNHVITVSDGIETPVNSNTISITVNPALATTLNVSAYTLNQNVAYANLQPVSSTGGTPAVVWSVLPALPAGLTLNTATGQISGTPTGTQIGVDYVLTVTDANLATSSKTVNIAVISNSNVFAPVLSGANVAQTTTGDEDWSNTANVLAAGGGSATVNFTGSDESEYLTVRNFGLNVPPGATILGINVIVSRFQDGPGGRNISDENIFLTKNGTSNVGSNQAVGGTWPGTLTDITYAGGLWGTSWTPAEVNSANFGVRIQVEASGGGGSRQANIDHVQVQVIYLVP